VIARKRGGLDKRQHPGAAFMNGTSRMTADTRGQWMGIHGGRDRDNTGLDYVGERHH